jgi:hypothetical protein
MERLQVITSHDWRKSENWRLLANFVAMCASSCVQPVSEICRLQLMLVRLVSVLIGRFVPLLANPCPGHIRHQTFQNRRYPHTVGKSLQASSEAFYHPRGDIGGLSLEAFSVMLDLYLSLLLRLHEHRPAFRSSLFLQL